MTTKSADFSTLAPRLSHVEDLAEWLKNNRGSDGGGDGGGGLSDDDKRLWRATLLYSDDAAGDGAQPNDNWLTPTWYQANGMSLHAAIFGYGTSGVARTTNKSLYEQLFKLDDNRWSSGNPPYVNSSLSTEVLGVSGDGYTTALRTKGWSLAQAIFKNASQIGGTNPTIVDKIDAALKRSDDLKKLIDALQIKLDELDADIHQTNLDLGALATHVDTQVSRLDARIDRI